MNNNLYREIEKQWKGKRYHSAYIELKSSIIKYFNLFEDKIVIDVGCNSGYFTYDISKYSKKVIGVENNPDYYNQTYITSKYIKRSHSFLNMDIATFINQEYEYNAVFACRILYHLSNKDIDLIKKIMLPRCKIVICVSSEKRKFKNKKNKYDLHFSSNIARFLVCAGLHVLVEEKNQNRHIIIGTR